MARARSFRRDRRGTAVIETAIVLPVLVLLALASFDITRGFVHKLRLQQYAQTGIELVVAKMTAVPTDAQIQAELATVSGLPTSAITVTRWRECDNAPVATNASCTSPTAVKADYIKIAVADTYQPALGAIGLDGMMQTAVSMTGEATVQLL